MSDNHLVRLTAETIGDMDGGKFGRLINRELRALEKDIYESRLNDLSAGRELRPAVSLVWYERVVE